MEFGDHSQRDDDVKAKKEDAGPIHGIYM